LYEEKNTQVANRSKADKASNGVRKPIIINDNDTSSLNDQNDPEQLGNLGIVVSNATAKWTDAQTENSLENINLTVKPGRLVAVIGPVGSGKVKYTRAMNYNIDYNIIKFITEFIITRNFTRIATFRRKYFCAWCSILCIARTVVICRIGSTKYFIWFANGQRTL